MRRLISETSPKMRLERARWLMVEIVPSAFNSFTQLTADTQFAQLGLALIAILSQVHSALRPIESPDKAQLSSNESSEAQPEAKAQEKIQADHGTAYASHSNLDLQCVDTGVAISRNMIAQSENLAISKATSKNMASSESHSISEIFGDVYDAPYASTKETRKKKKKKKEVVNLDDIFGDIANKRMELTKQTKEPIDFGDTLGQTDMVDKRPDNKDKVNDFESIFGDVKKRQKNVAPTKSKIVAKNTDRSAVPKVREPTTKETIDLDDIFGSAIRKESKKKKRSTKEEDVLGEARKKKAKSKSGMDMSDLFESL
ncbi:hypothetical protein CFIMG_006624RA [Ceratocystis fimbriata CBS 114723]|uniref:RNase MRP protein 1 RNA binding domain-containing protein n=1 Tax=Ceratocystis fimbriata CBS 114723 TaxID=1035309 RepID=A0A2C5WUE6_9PEZI|nr:hypothetical protein CFIMG_006624RA [Ceratocystis fimbriata CBS 114723]